MEPFENENELGVALRELRPQPESEFTAELDAHAAAGFPRKSHGASALARLRERLASIPPRRLLAPAGAFAVCAIVVATAVVATIDSSDPTSRERLTTTVTGAAEAGRAGSPSHLNEGFAESKAAAPATSTSGEAASAGGVERAAGGSSATDYQSAESISKPSGPYASQTGRRDIERSAEMVLGANPDEVRSAAAKVFDAVHAAGGIVLNSSIRDGEAGAAGADFELLIPSAKLGDALASISRVAEVRSRHEATEDITAPTVTTGERLRDTRARIESLLGELADADTDAERTAVEAQLRNERFRAAALRSRLSSLERRANFSRVQLRIETGTASSSSDGGGAGWGVGDGVDGAGRILAVAAGVTVVGLAILAPFALIALLVWLGRRAWLRRARRDALQRA